MSWKPVGRMVLVKLNTTGSALVLGDSVKYDHTGVVLGVGALVEEIAVGDTIIINGPGGVVSDPKLGEDTVLLPSAIVLAKRVDEPLVSH